MVAFKVTRVALTITKLALQEANEVNSLFCLVPEWVKIGIACLLGTINPFTQEFSFCQLLIMNPSLCKLVRSRWPDVGHDLCLGL